MSIAARMYAFNIITSRLDPASSDQATEASIAHAALALGLTDERVNADRMMLDELSAAHRDRDDDAAWRITNSDRFRELVADADRAAETSWSAAHVMDGR